MEEPEAFAGTAASFPDRSDVGRGIVRIGKKLMAELGIKAGEPVCIN